MSNHVHLPAAPLADYATLIWEVNAPGGIDETILPRGIVEIVFQLDTPVLGLLPYSTRPVSVPRCFIQGFNTHVIKGRYEGRQHLLGIQLQAHRVRELLGVPPAEFMDAAVDLTLIRPSFGALWQRLAEATSFEARVAALYDALPVLNESTCPRSAQLNALVRGATVDAFRSVDALSRSVCYSTRQLGRVSKQLFGLSPETLTSYKKFMEAVQAMHRPHRSLTEIAYETGFCDQAHFTRVFKSFSGLTPKEYNRRRSALPFHLF